MDPEETPEKRHASPSWRGGLLFSVVVLNVILPSLVLSYGVILAYNADQGVPEWISIISPTVLTFTFCLTQCWCREAADSWGGDTGYRVMASAGILTVFAGTAACAVVPSIFQPLLYGLLGGLGTSLVSSQVDAVVFDTYDTRLGLVRGLCFAGQAMGQFLLPHIFLAFLECYGSSMFYLILSAFVLQTLPGVMCLKAAQSVRRPYSYSRYSDIARNYALFNNDVVVGNGGHNDLQLYDLSKKCWQSPSDDKVHRNCSSANENEDKLEEPHEPTTTITPPPSPEEKRKNIFGVEILPEIPEENEASSDDEYDSDLESGARTKKKYLHSALKRLSVMSDQFEDYITRADGRYSELDENDNKRHSEIDITYSNISPMTEIKHENVLNSFSFRCRLGMASFKRNLCIPSYRLYRIRRRVLFCIYSANDTFIKPLSRSLSCWQFYPALLLCFSKLSLTVIPSALIPIFSLRAFPHITLLENNFLLSLYAFTWLCFLLSTPWIAHLPKSSYKYIVVGGLGISTVALFVISNASTHDAMAIGCVIGGFGFGAINSTWEMAARDFVGVRKWSKIQSTLETLSGTCLATFVGGLAYVMTMEQGLKLAVTVVTGAQAVVTVVWLVISIVSFYNSAVKSYRLTKSIWSH